MDKTSKDQLAPPISLLGASFYTPENQQDQTDVIPYLKQAKLKKYLSKQDRLAIIGFAKLLENMPFDSAEILKRSGLYICVGYIPFEENTINSLAKESQIGGKFCMDAFTSSGISSINPLTTFKCLPNMPAYHISSTFDLQGPSFTTYPGTGQLYQAMEIAMLDIEMGKIDFAFVGAVCDQQNFLVKNLHQRIGHTQTLLDASGFCCLANTSIATQEFSTHGKWDLETFQVKYQSFDPLVAGYLKSSDGQFHYGSADFFHAFQNQPDSDQNIFQHQYTTMDGFSVGSKWARKATN